MTDKLQTREEWLNSLNVGDTVCYNTASFVRSYTLSKIKRITPKRRFILDNNKKFNDTGVGNLDKWRQTQLEKLTEDIKKEIKTKKYITNIKNTNINNLQYEKLKKINNIINT